MGERVYKNVRNIQKLTNEYNTEFKLKTQIKEPQGSNSHS